MPATWPCNPCAVKVQTEPGCGSMQVYAGMDYLDLVNLRSATSGTKWATLTSSSATVKVTKVRFVATSFGLAGQPANQARTPNCSYRHARNSELGRSARRRGS